MVKKLLSGIYNLVLGMITTSKHLTRKSVTLQYPTEKWEMPERSRGIVVLLSDKETGELNCTTCLLCMRACPCAAIRIENHKDEETKKRILDDFIVDHTICCYCGLCEEACNFAAIKLATKYEHSVYNPEELVHHTKQLQDLGRDVPYEKPVRKSAAEKAVAKPAPKSSVEKKADTPKPEKTEEAKPVEANPEEKKSDESSEDKN
ncbi:MAG: hypothetical protein ABIJ45_00945 [Candidatus Zixiibacteriota bacterium]